MKLVLLNPHTFHFRKIPARFFNGKKNLFRYSYLLDNHMNELEIALMANGSRTSFQKNYLRRVLLNKVGSFLEIVFWLLLNRINPLRYKIYSTTKKLDPSSDVLFTFGVDICQMTPNQLDDLMNYEGMILVHLTHYFYDPVGIAKVCGKLSNVVIVSESDLTNNAFFGQHFSKEFRRIILPFAFAERFVEEKINVKRINKCVAVGTVLTINQPNYPKSFGDGNNVLQPMRKRIFDEAAHYPEEFVNIMRDPASLRLGAVENRKNLNLDESQIEKSYYKIELVDYFKSYSMFISPEEFTGLPSSNFVDGMISGCVYLGANLEFYESFGMRSGIHFISYKENDFEDLVRTIRYYQENSDELQRISQAGKNFAASNFSPERVRENLVADLQKLSL